MTTRTTSELRPASPRVSTTRRAIVGFLVAVLVAGPNAGCKSFFWPAATITAEHQAYYHQKVAEIDTQATLMPPVLAPEIYGLGPEIRDEIPVDRSPEERLSDDLWPMTMYSAVRLALEHNPIIRQDSQFLSANNPLLNTIDANSSIYDPQIQDTNILFGNRGLAAAAADFNPQLTGAFQWGEDDQFNNVGALVDFSNSTRQLQLRLEKQLAFGGTLGLNHNVTSTSGNNPTTTLDTFINGDVSVDFSMPLWAASGTEFTQIAGPASFLVPRVTSVNQGVIISQISSHVARLDLESAVRGLVRDTVNLYWDLHLAYARVKTEQQATEAAKKVLDKSTADFEAGRTRAAEEAQSAETYYAAKSRFEEALRIYDETERRMRRLLGLPISDGRLIQPIDEPTLVPIPSAWNPMLAESIARRPQLRRSKHNIRSLQLQLKAARSLARPRLDFVSSYSLNGFGDELTGDSNQVGNFYKRIGDRTLSGWTAGFQLNMPLGFQQQRSQVNNLELRVAKSRAQLAIAEAEIAHELALRLQNAQRWTRIVKTNDERRDAAARLVNALEADFEFQDGDLDQLVRAQATYAQAEVEYRRSLVEFRKALAELDFSRSALLEANHIDLVFPDLTVAGNVNGAPRPVWTDALPGGHHLARKLPMDPVTADPFLPPAGSGGAMGFSAIEGEITTREVGRPRSFDDEANDGDLNRDDAVPLPPEGDDIAVIPLDHFVPMLAPAGDIVLAASKATPGPSESATVQDEPTLKAPRLDPTPVTNSDQGEPVTPTESLTAEGWQ